MRQMENSNAEPSLRVLSIVPGTSVDGPGLRTSIYFAGCAHKCEGCHNPQSWDFSSGTEMTIGEIVRIVEENGFNVTFSGGDPLYQVAALTELAKALKIRGYGIWCYTGFLFEQLREDSSVTELLSMLDVIVDGPFVLQQRDTSLLFRGSANQRIINVGKTLQSGIVSLWQDEF